MVVIDNPNVFADKYKLKSPRLKNFDYSSPGLYFITICTYRHNNFFGKIINNKHELSKMGLIVNQCLIDIPKHFKKITLDEYIVMPNHVHILFHVETPYMASTQKHSSQILTKNISRNLKQTNFNHVETHHDASLTKRYNNYFYHRIAIRSSQTIPLIIKQFKSAVTRQINSKTVFFAWQPRYHDIIIKDEKQYFTIKNYIKNNVINWEKDKYFSK